MAYTIHSAKEDYGMSYITYMLITITEKISSMFDKRDSFTFNIQQSTSPISSVNLARPAYGVQLYLQLV